MSFREGKFTGKKKRPSSFRSKKHGSNQKVDKRLTYKKFPQETTEPYNHIYIYKYIYVPWLSGCRFLLGMGIIPPFNRESL